MCRQGGICMCALDQDLKTLIQEAAEFVADLPESIQPLAFQLLVHGQTCPSSVPNVGKTDTVDVAPEPEPEPSPPMDEGAGWASILAREAGVAEDKIRSLLGRDEEGLYVIHADFGDREADRIRNIGVLVLWGARVLTKDIYAPQTLLYRAHTRLGQSTRNITNAMGREPTARAVNVAGQKMFQLIGDWRTRAAQIIKTYAE